jgi:queuine/archaeosine tRNA-ribosyltransferase
MSSRSLEEAMERAERALLRIERAVERGPMHGGRDEKLRANVANAIAELDEIIRGAGH